MHAPSDRDSNRTRCILPAKAPPFAATPSPSIAAPPDHLSTRLAHLEAATEREFLQIGTHLAEFHRQSKALLERSRTIALHIVREKTPATLLHLQAMFHSLEETRQEMVRMTAEEGRALESVLGRIEGIREQTSAFRQTTKMLQSLAVAIRIESCRDGREDFSVVGRDLKKVADSIGSRCSQILESVEGLHQCRRHAGELLLTLHDRQTGEAGKAFDRAGSSLNGLTARTEEAVRCTSTISILAERPSREIEEIIVSLQCQDIVRQKFEHIRMALADLANGHAEHGEEICRVQRAQLEQAREELINAVRQIASRLHKLARQVEEIAEATRKAAGFAAGSGSSLIQEMAEATTFIARLLQEGFIARHEVVAALGKVAAAAKGMSDLLDAMEQLGAELKVLALNAGIRAAHGGHQGASLGVIANVIQLISEEALSRARFLSAELRLVLSVGDRFEAIGAEGSSNDMTAGALTLLRDLQEIDAELTAGLATIKTDAASLAGQLHGVASSLTLHDEVDREIESAIADLELIIRQLRTAPRSGKDGLRELWSRYTMQSEREIHRTVHAQAGRSRTRREEQISPATHRGSEFGENVEIF